MLADCMSRTGKHLDNLSLCTAGGKNPLGGSKAVGLTMTMLDGWRLEFTTVPAGGS